jgi:uncharacterized protein YbjT (DUF2867 family)
MGLIAVTGATGRLGGRVAAALPQARLLVRDPTRVAGADVVRSSYAEPAGLEGVETLFMVSAAEHPARVDQHRCFLDAAAAAGVRRVVYTSFLGAAPDATFTRARDHWATEEHLRALGLPFVALRDSLYADFVPLLVSDGALRGPAGSGRVAPVAVDDVAAAAVAALLDGSVVGVVDLTGPELLSVAELAAHVGVPYVEETLDEAWASRRGLAPHWEVEGWISTYLAIADGSLAVVSDGVERLTGRPPRSLAEVLGVTRPGT